MIDIYLTCRSNSVITIEFSISLRHFSKPDNRGHVSTMKFCNYWCGDDRDFQVFSRQTVFEYLTEGALICEVRMKLVANSPWVFYPENPSSCETIRQMFMDKKSADVVFEVEDEADDEGLPTIYYAHSLILKNASPLLAELCRSSPCTVPISDVSPYVFNCLLRAIYGCDSSDIGAEMREDDAVREVIEAADKYGLTNLKLRAEVFYVSILPNIIDLDTFMDQLHFANSKNCYLLQEAVMDFIVENKIEILEKKMLAGAPESIVYDILSAVARREIERAAGASKKNSLNVMSLSELRRRAHSRGMEVDGSREMLISALKTASAPATDNAL